jgi:hypothetical protein
MAWQRDFHQLCWPEVREGWSGHFASLVYSDQSVSHFQLLSRWDLS